jgi:hypothetical protein
MNERENILANLIKSHKSMEATSRRLGNREEEKYHRESAETFLCQLLGYPQPPSCIQEEKKKDAFSISKVKVETCGDCVTSCSHKCSG